MMYVMGIFLLTASALSSAAGQGAAGQGGTPAAARAILEASLFTKGDGVSLCGVVPDLFLVSACGSKLLRGRVNGGFFKSES